MGKKVGVGKKRGAKCLAAILSAGMLVSQMSIGALATDQGTMTYERNIVFKYAWYYSVRMAAKINNSVNLHGTHV